MGAWGPAIGVGDEGQLGCPPQKNPAIFLGGGAKNVKFGHFLANVV